MLGDSVPGVQAQLCSTRARIARRVSACQASRLVVIAALALLVGATLAGAAPGGAAEVARLASSEAVSAQRAAPDRTLERARPAPEAGVDQPLGVDPVHEPAGAIVSQVPGPFRSFEGISNNEQQVLFGVNKVPPDTTGDIGPNHYVQAVNTLYSVYDRDGSRLAGPTAFAGAGGLFEPLDPGDAASLYCDDHNRGDPVVLYDELADRWLIAQFAFDAPASVPVAPFKLCVAVSTTPNPTGSWFLYEFELSNSTAFFPDYPKIGVWQDAYYVSANAFDLTQSPAKGVGGFALALERDELLVGGAARPLTYTPALSDSRFFGLLPADLDGAAPPAGAPGLFLALGDDNFIATETDSLKLWSATVAWPDSPATPTLSLVEIATLSVPAFDSALCGGSRDCIPQPDTAVGLDPLSGQLLHRLAYRNFGTHESLVAAHVADVSGADHAGMRWYELRDSGAGWQVLSASSFAPDDRHRWMGSIAMDAQGNIGLGYTSSSSTVFPSLNYSGRYATDDPGVLTQGEGTLVAGGGSQLSPTNRWGDYSTLSIDPNDGCTFWFTSAYYPATAMTLWHTRIGTFSLVTDPTLKAKGHAPGVWSSDTTVDVTLKAANASCGLAGYSTAWSTDPAVPANSVVDTTSKTITSPKLSEGGGHYLRVRTVDTKGNAADGAVLGPFRIDLTSPVRLRIRADMLESAQTTRRFPVYWRGTDALSGVARYAVRYRRATATGGFGPRKLLKKNTRRRTASFRGKPGSTYCFSVRAKDAAGNNSKFSRERCTAVPLDDRQIDEKEGWKLAKQPDAYKRTVVRSSKKGASLVEHDVHARGLALIATRCARCGKVVVRHGGARIGVINLSRKPFGTKMVNALPSSKRLRKGDVTVTIISRARRIVVDGLVTSRARLTG